MNRSLPDLRIDYSQQSLLETDVNPDPIVQFQQWFDEALVAQLPEPNAMTIATATPDGIPSARIVLLKGVDSRGFVFFTNYNSQKGQELLTNPRAALVFHWTEQERQVRIQGTVEKISPIESDAYYDSRPAGSRLGAWASDQSQVIPDRSVLENRLEQLKTQHPDGDIPRPEHWGGFRVMPQVIEFWQGRSNRLHDRLRYQKIDSEIDSKWTIDRLAP
jgi:pyridoxamine 5'-phosphate oxidase